MNKLVKEYQTKLDLFTTQLAIKYVKDTFQKELASSLNLRRVTAPIFVDAKSGLNDHLSGTEKPVSFRVNNVDDDIEIVQSLAKWKRMALYKYGFTVGTGLYTDMNAIRKDEHLDFIHSLYVDQWDWELPIYKENRNLEFLKEIVGKIYSALKTLSVRVHEKYEQLTFDLPDNITFISTSELEDMYPTLSRKERENEITRKYKAVFLYQIGFPLKDGLSHDTRAADYDDWNLNGDILVYYDLYDMALELSSMGIRVDKDSLLSQLKYKNELYKLDNDYCQSILNDNLPLTIGGGIGQSRLCMFMLKKAHIGEVQVSVWPKEEIDKSLKENIHLL